MIPQQFITQTTRWRNTTSPSRSSLALDSLPLKKENVQSRGLRSMVADDLDNNNNAFNVKTTNSKELSPYVCKDVLGLEEDILFLLCITKKMVETSTNYCQMEQKSNVCWNWQGMCAKFQEESISTLRLQWAVLIFIVNWSLVKCKVPNFGTTMSATKAV